MTLPDIGNVETPVGATVVRTADASSPGCLPIANASACRKGLCRGAHNTSNRERASPRSSLTCMGLPLADAPQQQASHCHAGQMCMRALAEGATATPGGWLWQTTV